MNDTPEDVRAQFRRRLLRLDASRRLRMASGMFETARVLARAGLSQKTGNAEPAAFVLFQRLYGREFGAEELATISEHFRRAAAVESSEVPASP